MIQLLPRKFQRLYYLTTFIGIVAHEFAHKHILESRGIEVKEVVYFKLSGDNLGYVKHGPMRTYQDVVASNTAPLIVNTAISICLFTGLSIYTDPITSDTLTIKVVGITIFMIWFGGSLLLHSIPSLTDISNIKNTAQKLWEKSKISVTSKPISVIQKQRTVIKIFLSPITTILEVIQVTLFTLRYPSVVLSLPVIYSVYLLNKSQKYGGNFIYTIVIILVSHQMIAPTMLDLIAQTDLVLPD